MAATCPHGFAVGTCLICQTLTPAGQSTKATRTAVAGAPVAAGGRGRARQRSEVVPATPVSPLAAAPVTAPRTSTGRGLALRGLGVVALLVVVGVIAFLVAGLLSAVFHVLELAVVALLAAWIGYRIGHYKGRHERQDH